MINKVPDLIDSFVPLTRSLLNEKNHGEPNLIRKLYIINIYCVGVMLSGVVLVTEVCRISPESVSHFRKVLY